MDRLTNREWNAALKWLEEKRAEIARQNGSGNTAGRRAEPTPPARCHCGRTAARNGLCPTHAVEA